MVPASKKDRNGTQLGPLGPVGPQRFESSYVSISRLPIEENYSIFEVFTAVTMKNVFFWYMKTQFVPHRRHITSPLQSPTQLMICTI
jgi:hypothetical protein